jgi:hypothetical protein
VSEAFHSASAVIAYLIDTHQPVSVAGVTVRIEAPQPPSRTRTIQVRRPNGNFFRFGYICEADDEVVLYPETFKFYPEVAAAGKLFSVYLLQGLMPPDEVSDADPWAEQRLREQAEKEASEERQRANWAALEAEKERLKLERHAQAVERHRAWQKAAYLQSERHALHLVRIATKEVTNRLHEARQAGRRVAIENGFVVIEGWNDRLTFEEANDVDQDLPYEAAEAV